MKNYFLYALAFLCISFVSCSGDDDSCSGQSQAIAIEIEGAALSNITGTASVSQDQIGINIIGESSNDSRVFFSAPNEVGTFDLNFGTDSQTITAFVPDGFLNIILSSGCFEIVSIDASEVVMRFNVNEDDTSIVGQISLEAN